MLKVNVVNMRIWYGSGLHKLRKLVKMRADESIVLFEKKSKEKKFGRGKLIDINKFFELHKFVPYWHSTNRIFNFINLFFVLWPFIIHS